MMKKRKVFGLVVAALLAGFVSHALADGATAYSSSAVGVIRKTLPGKKLALVSIPLDQEPIVENNTVVDGFKFASVAAISNMPNGSVANFWDVETQSWIPQEKTAKGGWGKQKDRIIKPGEAFFLYNAQVGSIELVISGEVPDDDSIGMGIASNALSSVANPYPVSMVFTNFSFAADLPAGSTANFWDEENQTWIPQEKTTKGGWGKQKDREIKPGEGFFILSKSDYSWIEPRLYTWPAPSEN